jgi:hypothetical protein
MDVLPVRPPMAPLIIRTFFTYMSIHDKYNQIKLLFFFVDLKKYLDLTQLSIIIDKWKRSQ